MISKDINVDDLKLAKLKYFDKDHKGVEVSEFNAYVFLVNIGGKYINVFDESLTEIPVFERTHYSNTTSSGIDFGTKLVHLSGELESGPCYIIEHVNIKRMFRSETVTLDDVKNYMMDSSDFFIDRESISNVSDIPRKERRRFKAKLFADRKEKDKINEYFAEKDCGFQYIK